MQKRHCIISFQCGIYCILYTASKPNKYTVLAYIVPVNCNAWFFGEKDKRSINDTDAAFHGRSFHAWLQSWRRSSDQQYKSYKRQNDFVRGILSETLNREEALETFELLDKDKDGNLTVKEIATLFGDDIKGEKF